jgi:crotonobetainyl-CoA:carnitine CoA-transferase CaiB-like acyl-CoA transferase
MAPPPDPPRASGSPPSDEKTSGLPPLVGLRVLEVGQILAGPFAGAILGYFGADVIKVEPPGRGDPIRGWRLLDEAGTSYWWRSLGRNKRCVTLDLAHPEGQAIARRLASRSDVLIENFKPGTMERWGLGPEELRREAPRLVYARVSGFGQTGPYAHRPGYASVCEAFGGLRHLTGVPGEPPVRANLSLGDSLAGLHAALGILLALEARRRNGAGQVVDVAIFESVFNVLEGVVPEFAGAGVVRGPSGTTISGIVPSNAYPTADGRPVVIGANNAANFARLMRAAGRDDLADDPALARNAERVARREEIDSAIADWTSTLRADELIARLDRVSVPAAKALDVAEMWNDPHYRARGLFESVGSGEAATPSNLETVVPALAPRLEATPGATRWAGPEIAAANEAVYGGELGLSGDEIRRLTELGVI